MTENQDIGKSNGRVQKKLFGALAAISPLPDCKKGLAKCYIEKELPTQVIAAKLKAVYLAEAEENIDS